MERLFPLLPDTPEVYYEWRRLVRSHATSGKSAHDARLIAAMKVHGIANLLTFNGGDFKRYRDVQILHPSKVEGPIVGRAT
jgi:predicted nucleic acid-binding protein